MFIVGKPSVFPCGNFPNAPCACKGVRLNLDPLIHSRKAKRVEAGRGFIVVQAKSIYNLASGNLVFRLAKLDEDYSWEVHESSCNVPREDVKVSCKLGLLRELFVTPRGVSLTLSTQLLTLFSWIQTAISESTTSET